MATLKAIACVELRVEPNEEHFKIMRYCAACFSVDDDSIVISLVPDTRWTVAVEFIMNKMPKGVEDGGLKQTFEDEVPDNIGCTLSFPCDDSQERKARKPGERAKNKRTKNATPADGQQTVGIVFKGAKHEMSKAQKAFMKAKDDVERMQKKLADSTEKCEKLAARHAELTSAPLADVGELQRKLIRICDTLIAQGKKPPHKYVRKKLASCIRELFMSLEDRGVDIGDELEAIKENIRKTYYNEFDIEIDVEGGASARPSEEGEGGENGGSSDDRFEQIKKYLQKLFFQQTGFEINLDCLRPDMDDQEMSDYMESVLETFKVDSAPRKKTKRQLEKEAQEKEVEEARAKNITTVYRQLARILHPDLEQDPVLKKKKEALMKELTVAYEKNDLHMILGLELRWLQNNDGDIARLSDAKLDAYTAALKQQSAELFNEIQNLMRHPRFAVLSRLRIWLTDSLPSLQRVVEEDAEDIGKWAESLRQSIKMAEQFQAMPESPIRSRELREFAKALERVLVDQTDEFDTDPFAFF